jgi:hypothetical protein
MRTRPAAFVLAIALVVTPGRTSGQELAWWLTAAFEPRDSAIQGIAVRDIDPTWSKASLLRDTTLPAAATAPGESVAALGGAFEVTADFEGHRRPEMAVVGVYSTVAGMRGRFLLVLRANKAGKWTKRALFTEPGPPGFSVLFLQNGRLLWAFCMTCDGTCEVVPSRSKWALKCHGDFG